MKTQYYTASSLDGFIATEDDSLDWLFPLGNPDDAGYPAFIADVGALAMGARLRVPGVRHLPKPLDQLKCWRAPGPSLPTDAG